MNNQERDDEFLTFHSDQAAAGTQSQTFHVGLKVARSPQCELLDSLSLVDGHCGVASCPNNRQKGPSTLRLRQAMQINFQTDPLPASLGNSTDHTEENGGRNE